MQPKRFALAVQCVCVFALCQSATLAADDEDWQFWTTESVDGRLPGGWRGKLEGEFYFQDDLGDLIYRHADAGVSRKLADWFTLGLNYRYAEEEKNGAWRHENRPHVNGTFSQTFAGLRLADRNRLEYRGRENADDVWRYRNRAWVGIPMTLLGMKCEPYVNDEVFIDSDAKELNQNRVAVGITAAPTASLKLELYYLRMSVEKDDDWTDTNVFGTSVALTF